MRCTAKHFGSKYGVADSKVSHAKAVAYTPSEDVVAVPSRSECGFHRCLRFSRGASCFSPLLVVTIIGYMELHVQTAGEIFNEQEQETNSSKSIRPNLSEQPSTIIDLDEPDKTKK